MTSSGPDIAPCSLIIGCGYLGQQLAPMLLAHGSQVFGTTRGQRAASLAALGVRPLYVDVTQKLTLAALRPALASPSLDVYCMVPPGRPDADPSPRQVLIDGVGRVLRMLQDAPVRRALLVSSTAVYSQTGGAVVDAHSPAQPHDPRGQLLLEAEARWLDVDWPACVVRLAGLYGPGRVIGLHMLREQAPLVGDPHAWLNLIHVEDAAALLLAVMRTEAPHAIELGCDDEPTPRVEYYSYLAQRLNLPPLQVLQDEQMLRLMGMNVERLKRTSSKRCSNAATCRRTGWRPRFANYRQGLESILAQHA